MRIPPHVTWLLTLAMLFGSALSARPVDGAPSGDDPELRADPPGVEGGDGGGGDGGQGGGGDDREDEDEEEERDRRPIFTTMSGSDPESVRDRYPEWGVEPSLSMTQWAFDPEHTGWWERPDRTDYWLEAHVPVDYSGFLTIDWEHPVFEHLMAGVEDPRFFEIIGEMVRLATYVKQQRPQAKVGYYAIPLSRPWNQDETWRTASRAMQPIYDACDVLFLNMYDHKRDDPSRVEALKEIVRFAMELADGKPVLLYTWHRYHPWTEGYGFSLIPRSEYVSHIRSLLAVEWEGQRPHGCVSWGATKWYYEEAFAVDKEGEYVRQAYPWSQIRSAFTNELHPGETIDAYVARLHAKVYERLATAATE